MDKEALELYSARKSVLSENVPLRQRRELSAVRGDLPDMYVQTQRRREVYSTVPSKRGRNGAADQTSMLLLPEFAKARRPKLHSGLTTPSWIIVTAISIMVSDTGCNPPSSFNACKRHHWLAKVVCVGNISELAYNHDIQLSKFRFKDICRHLGKQFD